MCSITARRMRSLNCSAGLAIIGELASLFAALVVAGAVLAVDVVVVGVVAVAVVVVVTAVVRFVA